MSANTNSNPLTHLNQLADDVTLPIARQIEQAHATEAAQLADVLVARLGKKHNALPALQAVEQLQRLFYHEQDLIRRASFIAGVQFGLQTIQADVTAVASLPTEGE